MDRARFSQLSPGDVVEIEGGECAFVPHQLPPAGWALTEASWLLLTEAMHELGRLDGVAVNLPEPGILLRPLENREALRSSSLEGTYATPRELLLFDLPDDAAPSDKDQEIQSWREVLNYRNALTQCAGRSVSEAPLYLIRQLHSILMTGVRGQNKDPGAFRKGQVFIGSDHRFTPPPSTHVPQCLEEFESFLKSPPQTIPPLLRAFLAHYQFETIHPFGDGNGRVGRLLMAIMIRELCRHQRPWLYLSAFFDKHKDEYIDSLFRVSSDGAWSPWVDFCLRATISQAKDTFDRCTRLLALREQYRNKVGDRARLSKIVDALFQHPMTRISSLAKMLEVSYPTAKTDVGHLESLGILRELPNAYPRTHYAPGIYEITFAEPGEGAPSIEK